LESNHDLEMLRNGPYPWYVKQRVMSRDGHLSNSALGEFLRDDFDVQAQVLVLAHLSQQNNHPQIARLEAASALEQRNAGTTRLVVSTQDEPTEVFWF
ncbi:MAG: MBL fold metallo-hydrolase, partial [Acidobacteria bacterium]|nr:MBL fold metallo-hydrolase [Acidobacteriota bacterium]